MTAPQIVFPTALQEKFEKVKLKVKAYQRDQDDQYQTQVRALYSELEILKIDFQNHIFKELRQQSSSSSSLTNNETKNEHDKTETSVPDEKYLANLDKQLIEIWERPSPSPFSSSSSSLSSDFEELRKTLSINRKGLLERFSLLIVIKGLALVMYLVLSFFFFFPLFIVRIFHPILSTLFGIRNNNLPGDQLVRYYTGGFLTVLGTEVEVENAHLLDLSQPTIGMFSHSSNYDAFIVSAHSPIAFKWIGKTSIFWIPFLGWMGWVSGMIPIDRSNIQSAILALERAAYRAKKGNRSIAISPEGTRSKSGLLGSFKKGPFHLTKNTELSITPILIFGAFELYPPKQILPSPGKVVLRFLGPIKYDKKLTLTENSLKVRREMLNELGSSFPENKLKERQINAEIKSYCFIAFLFFLTSLLIQFFFF